MLLRKSWEYGYVWVRREHHHYYHAFHTSHTQPNGLGSTSRCGVLDLTSLGDYVRYAEGQNRPPDPDQCPECRRLLRLDAQEAPLAVTDAVPTASPAVDHPAHYTYGQYEVIDVIEDWALGFHLGNVVKYVARADHKGEALADLRKAAWYLTREIQRREGIQATADEATDTLDT